MTFCSLSVFEVFLTHTRKILAAELQDHPYNTMGSFIAFYHDFINQNGELSVKNFFQQYNARILPYSLSCVGLSCSFLNAAINSELGLKYPELQEHLYIVSCEEMITDVESYVDHSPPSQEIAVKEHVLVALRVRIEGRAGYVLLDPGYHVGIPIVVMEDGQAPHTGWFLQCETSKSRKEYCYEYQTTGYLAWKVKDTRNGKVNQWTNLIYVQKRFLSHVAVSEKRNLAFNFRSFVVRDERGPVAGLYCNLEGLPHFTLFYQDSERERREVRIPFSSVEDSAYDHHLAVLATLSRGNLSYLREMMRGITRAQADTNFMPYIAELNQSIDE